METVAFFTLSYASGTFILLLTTGFLAYISKNKYLKTWTMYWATLTTAYASLYSFDQTNNIMFSLLYVFAVIVASFLFIYGVYNLLEKPFTRGHAYIFLAIMIVLTIFNATLSNEPIQALIQSMLISVFFYGGSILLLLRKTSFYILLGSLGMLLAINYTLFPLLYDTSWYVPYGYITIGMVGMIFGLGIIAHYLMGVQQENKAMQETLIYMNQHDALTSTYNRGYFDEYIAFHESKKTTPFSMIVLDLNDLKKTNDQYGHRRGDAFLVALASILLATVKKPDDKVVRYGGDEFVVLLPNYTNEQAQTIVDTIKTRVNTTVINNLTLSAAIGLATRKQQEEALTDVFDRAEENMYKNKNAM